MMSNWSLIRAQSSFPSDDGYMYSIQGVESDFMYIRHKKDALKMMNAERMLDLLESMLRSHDSRAIELPNYYARDIASIIDSCNDIDE